ncbi:DNA-binding transcriptional response regulator, NtrC family, contains REC, AAA-type ATPase, and a Fis-type DNA-binding domains [Solimonas aquatica]|uniref:DNA-binding transcriptional response regulator, NtrC family, contains REC, AAA-type ATPase, and a Fis-type DNA-binding domains n=1 Tax=Solimonas aquatica TaxID=489703 RepID=A0A1H9F1K7_9GAMM|nr:sigma-54 dependent transcriptional regulator [Solimonas aquatica]SEQ31343.1 DNA-binding transcriptional response regulator, NtrC family, contains REC, AAA-type ATPase, and a Fis-type DNA-binding domains [Solimonas aquatica]
MNPRRCILVVDDEPRLREVIADALDDLGYRTLSADSAEAALQRLAVEPVDLVLSDLRMPGQDGHALLQDIRSRHATIPVVLMTAYSTVKDAVQMIKEGAFDYIAKPFEIGELSATIGNALRLSAALQDNQRLRRELESRYRFDHLIGASAAFRRVIGAIAEVCESRANVLLTGESGTGKELAARAIHYNSARRNEAFVAINCAAIPEGLLESELFGHVKGAFTGAVSARPGRFVQANGGTVFLDEIGDMPVSIQAKILRVLQERVVEPVGGSQSRSVDVRVIAATHRDLREAVRSGGFRHDLYYRLNVFPIELPPLRERREDIPLLLAHFLQELGKSSERPMPAFTPAALRLMERYSWPGNIRELQNCVERAVIVARNGSVDAGDLPAELHEPVSSENGGLPSDLDAELERLERRFVLEALARTNGVQVQAAELLGISERSLWHRIKKLGINIVKRPSST